MDHRALSEVRVLEKNETWVKVPVADAKMKILPGTWVFRHKRTPDGIIKKHKGHYCCRGDLEEGEIDMTAYIVFWSTVHLFLVLSLTWGWTTCSIDFASAFVQAKLENLVWIHVPRLCLEKPASASARDCTASESLLACGRNICRRPFASWGSNPVLLTPACLSKMV